MIAISVHGRPAGCGCGVAGETECETTIWVVLAIVSLARRAARLRRRHRAPLDPPLQHPRHRQPGRPALSPAQILAAPRRTASLAPRGYVQNFREAA
jgi:hypothetical protein